MLRTILYTTLFIFLFSYLFSGCKSSRKDPPPVPATPGPTATATENPKAFIINPGNGIGRVQVNKSKLISVEEWLGKADREEVTDGEEIKLTYEKHKLTFFFTTDNQVLKSVLIKNPDYKTSEGICVGSNIVDVKTLYDGVLNKKERVYIAGDGAKYYYDSGNVTSILISGKTAPVATIKPSPKATNTPEATPSPQNIPTENPTQNTADPLKNYLEEAGNILNELEELESIGKTFPVYENYSNHVTETQIKVDKFLRDNPVSYIPQFNEEINSAMVCYRDAKTFWHAVLTAGTYAKFRVLTVDIFRRHPELAIALKRMYNRNDIYLLVKVNAAGKAGAVILWEEGNEHVNRAERLLQDAKK